MGRNSELIVGHSVIASRKVEITGNIQRTANHDTARRESNRSSAGNEDNFILKSDTYANYLVGKWSGGSRD